MVHSCIREITYEENRYDRNNDELENRKIKNTAQSISGGIFIIMEAFVFDHSDIQLSVC